MQDYSLDFHGTFRRLCFFRPSITSSDESLNAFVDSILKLSSEPDRLDSVRAQSDWSEWLRKYAARIESERDLWVGEDADSDVDAAREKEAKGANPRFVLRQWLLEEVIKKVETDADSGKRVLAKVLKVRSRSSIRLLWVMSKHSDFVIRWLVSPMSHGALKARKMTAG